MSKPLTHADFIADVKKNGLILTHETDEKIFAALDEYDPERKLTGDPLTARYRHRLRDNGGLPSLAAPGFLSPAVMQKLFDEAEHEAKLSHAPAATNSLQWRKS